MLPAFASPADTIKTASSFIRNDNVLAILAGMHPTAIAAQSTVALETENSVTLFSIPTIPCNRGTALLLMLTSGSSLDWIPSLFIVTNEK